jgi:uncharacterized protein YbgA (DUF1722 family)/uncharacterized protein YbbK (DUF523 family)
MTISNQKESNAEIRIGISRCLLGENVRYDGGHKQDSFITGTLSNYFSWVPVCPEMEIGLGSPRESMKLAEINGTVHLITNKTGEDLTDKMNDYAELRIKELQKKSLHGFILKKDSPSCGIFRVRVYNQPHSNERKGRGLFAEALMNHYPDLPVEEEGRLQDWKLRENFIERVFSYYRWLGFVNSHPRAKDLVNFHTRQKLAILAHSRTHYQKLGQLVATSGKKQIAKVLADYRTLYMSALAVNTTRRKHTDVLYHILGYLKKVIDAQDKAEVVETIEKYRCGIIPLIVPLTLLNHHFRRHPVSWIQEQTYLNPYPAELMLRNQ